MGSDNLHLKRNEERKERKKDTKLLKSNYWLIVCEGKKTEPNYFVEAVKLINDKIDPKYRLKVKIEGKGMNTTSLVESAEDLQTVIDKYRNKIIPYGKTFVVFDKDNFSDDAFNRAVDMCNNNDFIPLWSNQAIEFWFLLHFNYIDCKMNRIDYSKKISSYFKNKGLNYEYKKNDVNIYSKLTRYGSLEKARKNALKTSCCFEGTTPSKSESCTMMYKFFDAVDERLDELK